MNRDGLLGFGNRQTRVILAAAVIHQPLPVVARQAGEEDRVMITRDNLVRLIRAGAVLVRILFFRIQNRPRQPFERLLRPVAVEQHFADRVEVAGMVAASEQQQRVGVLRRIVGQREAAFAARPQVADRLRLPMQQIIRVGDNAVVQVHDEFAVKAHRLVVRVLDDARVAMDAFGVRESDADFLPVQQIPGRSDETAVLARVELIFPVPLVAEQIVGVLMLHDASILVAVLLVEPVPEQRAVQQIALEVHAVVADRDADVANIVDLLHIRAGRLDAFPEIFFQHAVAAINIMELAVLLQHRAVVHAAAEPSGVPRCRIFGWREDRIVRVFPERADRPGRQPVRLRIERFSGKSAPILVRVVVRILEQLFVIILAAELPLKKSVAEKLPRARLFCGQLDLSLCPFRRELLSIDFHFELLMIVAELRIFAAYHHAAAPVVAHLDRGFVRGVAVLEQHVAPVAVARVQAGPVNRQVVEEQHVACLGRARRAAGNRILLVIEIIHPDMLQRTFLVRARDQADAPVLFVGIVQMDAGRHHRMLQMREIGIVLVQREGAAFLRRFDEHLAVVQLHVRTDNPFQHLPHVRMHSRPTERSVMVQHVVKAFDNQLFQLIRGNVVALPGGVAVELHPGRVADRPLDAFAHLLHFRLVEYGFGMEIAVVPIEVDIPLCDRVHPDPSFRRLAMSSAVRLIISLHCRSEGAGLSGLPSYSIV